MKTPRRGEKFRLDKPRRRCYNSAFLILNPTLYSQEATLQGYCVRCRAKQEMLSATRTLMKNGRRAMIGLCACCGTRMSVAGKWDDETGAGGVPSPDPMSSQSRLTGSGENG